MKILVAGADFFHADGQTDRQTDVTKLIQCGFLGYCMFFI